MNSWWYALDNEVDNPLCIAIRHLYNADTEQAGKIGLSVADTKTRDSKVIGYSYATDECKYLDSIVGKYIHLANRECFGFNLNNIKEFQIAKYNETGFYSEHMDTTISDNASQRKLSITVQLSDPDSYEGGDFEFTKNINTPDKKSLRNQGTILIFPSFLYHQITPVTKGTRYSLVGWYEGNKWK